MSYQKTIWINDKTPLNESNMNHIEEGIQGAHIFSTSNLTLIEELSEYARDLDNAKTTPAAVAAQIAEHNQSEYTHSDLRALIDKRTTSDDVKDIVSEAIAGLVEDNTENISKIQSLVEWLKDHESDALEQFTVLTEAIAEHDADTERHVEQADKDRWDEHVGDGTIHIADEERQNWNTHVDDNLLHVSASDRVNWDSKVGPLHTHNAEDVFYAEGEEDSTPLSDVIKNHQDQFAAILDEIKSLSDATSNDIQGVVDTKLDKVTEPAERSRLYGVTAGGEQKMWSIESGAAVATTVALRTTAGAIYTATPTNDAHAANKKYVDDKVDALIGGAGEALDTLKELAAALGDDPNFATTVMTALSNKAALNHTHPEYALVDHIHDFDAVASVDANVGTPSVTVETSDNGNGKTFSFDFKNIKGETGPQGETGATPTITASASVDANVGTPSVTVTKGGTTAAPTFAFAFKNIKGATGAAGTTPSITASASVDANVGTPSVTVTKGGTDAAPTFAFAFKNLKGSDASVSYYTSTPKADGTASAGTSSQVSRGDHVHPSDTTKLSLTGGTMSGDIIISKSTSVDTYFTAKRTDTGNQVDFGVGSGGVNRGIWDTKLGKWIFHTDGSKVYVNGVDSSTFTYTLPSATASTLGGVKLYSGTPVTSAVTLGNAASRTYGTQVDTSGHLVVNVPWTDTNTTYSAGTGLTLSGTTFSINSAVVTSCNTKTTTATTSGTGTSYPASNCGYVSFTVGARRISMQWGSVTPTANTTTTIYLAEAMAQSSGYVVMTHDQISSGYGDYENHAITSKSTTSFGLWCRYAHTINWVAIGYAA